MDALASLLERLPEGAVSTHPGELSSRSRDAWPLAMLREARGERLPRPMAVVFPRSTEDVAATLAWAAETGVPVVPRGAGSGVCGGAQAVWRGVVVDLGQMNRVLDIDTDSLAVRVEAGIRGDRLEAVLEERGLTLGHYPQSMAISTVGGWIATSSSGQASAGFGAIEDLVLGLVAVLPGGEVLELSPVPRSAAGPDLRRLLVGSEGTMGIVTEATLAAARTPGELRWSITRHGSFEAGVDVTRELIHAGLRPTVVRLYDEPDATVTFGALGHERGAVLVAGFPDRVWTEPMLGAARQAASAAGAEELDAAYGRHWWEHRNDAVDLYRRIMGEERMLGPGVVVDTVEVAGLWSGLPALYRAVRDALSEHAARPVACHLSHPYAGGASLYFTVLLHGEDDRSVEDTYAAAWRDAAGACHRASGTISHHHGIGLLKTPFMREELGDGGLRVLRSIKSALDPVGVLNPGKLLPPD
ncbi:MAG TPA: FAD-binding oxidoreductase [Actinomycetota bacterium]|nr:FAD-binding oxidoreductase [Actinomycetota bacterium]